MNSNNNNRKTTRKKKEKKEKHAENLEMSKTPTKIVQKKKKAVKHRNTTSREKKDVQNFVFRYKETQSFKKQKYVWQYMQKKPEPKFGGYFISYKYRLLRCFHKWAVSKRQKKRKKNTKPRIRQIWCPREIIRNKKTREKKNGTKKKTVSRKKRYTNLCLQKPKVLRNTSVKKRKVSRNTMCQVTKKKCVAVHKKNRTKYGGQYILYIKIIEVFFQMSCL